MKGRLLPLVAVPVLGIGLGGLAGRQGEVVVALLETLEHAVQEHEIDVVVVTPDRSVYAAVQHKRKSLRPDEASDRGQRRLGDLAARGQLALMIGAGASIPAGLPSWEELIDQLGANQDRSVPLAGQKARGVSTGSSRAAVPAAKRSAGTGGSGRHA